MIHLKVYYLFDIDGKNTLSIIKDLKYDIIF